MRIESKPLTNSTNNNNFAGYDPVNNEIVFSKKYLNDLLGYENCIGSFSDTVLHEWKHFLQHRLFILASCDRENDEIQRVARLLKIDYTMDDWSEFDIAHSFNIYRKYNNLNNVSNINEIKDLFLANYKFALLSDTSSTRDKQKQINDVSDAIDEYIWELSGGDVKKSHPFIVKMFKNFMSGQVGTDWMIKDDKLIKELQYARYLKKHKEQDARVSATNKYLEFVLAFVGDDCVPEGILNFLLYHELPFVVDMKKAEIKRRENNYALFDFFIDELEKTSKTKKLCDVESYFINKMIEAGRDNACEINSGN